MQIDFSKGDNTIGDFKGWISPVGSTNLESIIHDLGEDPARGAITTFTGVVRADSDSSRKRVTKIEIESWEGKGTESMNKICEEIGQKYDLLGLRIIHLEGEIGLGDPIVFIVISSAHRKEAFGALEDAINAYKHRSPVWKKEIYDDGTGEWITTATHDSHPNQARQ